MYLKFMLWFYNKIQCFILYYLSPHHTCPIPNKLESFNKLKILGRKKNCKIYKQHLWGLLFNPKLHFPTRYICMYSVLKKKKKATFLSPPAFSINSITKWTNDKLTQ